MNQACRFSISVLVLFSTNLIGAPTESTASEVIPTRSFPDGAQEPVPIACVGWKDGWIAYRFSSEQNRWLTWTCLAAELPKRGAYTRVSQFGAVVLDPLKNYEGWFFDFERTTWIKIPPSPVDGFAQGGKLYYDPVVIEVLRDCIFVWGHNRGPPHGAIFHVDRGTWIVIPEAPIVPRYRTLNTAIDNKIIVCGGIGGGAVQSDGAIFDVVTETWEKLPSPPITLPYGMVSTQYRGQLAIAGGRGNLQVATYSPASRTWKVSPKAPLVIGEFPACVAVNDGLFLWSGHGPDGELRKDGLRYDFQEQRWERLANAPIAGRWLAFAAQDQKRAIVWGGWLSDPERFLRDAAAFDFEKRSWQKIPDLPGDVPRALHPGW